MIAKAVCRPHGEHQVLGAAVLLVAQQFRKLFRGKLPPASIQENGDRSCASGGTVREFEQGGLRRQFMRLSRHVVRNALEIFRRERLNSWFPGFSNPGNLKFHVCDSRQ